MEEKKRISLWGLLISTQTEKAWLCSAQEGDIQLLGLSSQKSFPNLAPSTPIGPLRQDAGSGSASLLGLCCPLYQKCAKYFGVFFGDSHHSPVVVCTSNPELANLPKVT